MGSMGRTSWWRLAALLFAGVLGVRAASETVRLRNARVTAVEYTLGTGEVLALDALRPAVTVYLTDGVVAGQDDPALRPRKVAFGQTAFSPAGEETIRNSGNSPLSFVRVEFHGPGSARMEGMAGLPRNDKLLLENTYARVYEIKVPAGTTEPQHTHRDRVVICLSGARLKHVMPDGKEETATLETGEIVWRAAATHVGQNLGDTDLWVIAVEPK